MKEQITIDKTLDKLPAAYIVTKLTSMHEQFSKAVVILPNEVIEYKALIRQVKKRDIEYDLEKHYKLLERIVR